jgi:hypothetical protein
MYINMAEQVAILTIHQKDSLEGQMYAPYGYFNPVLDANANWIITEQEINESVYPVHEWVKDLPLTDWVGPYVPPVNE